MFSQLHTFIMTTLKNLNSGAIRYAIDALQALKFRMVSIPFVAPSA